jgi:hypothetical protein
MFAALGSEVKDLGALNHLGVQVNSTEGASSERANAKQGARNI